MALSKGSPSKGSASSHFLRLRSGGLYIGASMNLEHGLDHHASGRGRRTTRVDPPVSVWRIESFPAFTKDRSREPQLKRWTCGKKGGGFLGQLICFMPSVNPGNVGMAGSKGGVAAEGTSRSCRGLDRIPAIEPGRFSGHGGSDAGSAAKDRVPFSLPLPALFGQQAERGILGVRVLELHADELA